MLEGQCSRSRVSLSKYVLREREKYQEGKSEGIYYRMISSDVREGLRKANIGREMTLQLQSLTKLVTDEDLMS